MKRCLPFLLICCSTQIVFGQITTPVVKANFGIEADLSSNFFNNSITTTVDDWFNNGYAGSGLFIIDTTGAASIVAGYSSNPATRKMSFSRLMRQAPYTVINNKLLLDAIFHRDYHGDDSTVFASGSNKNGMSPSMWACPIAQGIPDKNDILDTYTHIRRDGPNATDSLWMFGGVSIENTTGSRYFDFELYQTDITYDRSTQSFLGYGPNAGHTSWLFDGSGNILTPGDIIFTAEFSSSSLSLVEARIWVKKTAMSITPATFNWGGDFDGDGAGAVYGYANIRPKTTGDFYTGIINATAATWAGAFALVRVNDSVVSTYLPKQFMEFSVNLTKLGIEPGSFSNNACGSPFRRVLIKSRSSTSFTAELKDFVAPFRLFNYQPVDAYTSSIYYCGPMPSTTINILNPVPAFVYNWTTNNGNITSAVTGSSITVNAPGTYYVTQQLHTQCPIFAKDSVTIIHNAVCQVLNVNITEFNVAADGNEAVLQWTAHNNEQAASYVIESSTNNRVFTQLAAINGDNKAGTAVYTYRSEINGDEKNIFYRVKVIGKNASLKYSNTAILRQGRTSEKTASIFPNPIHNEAWLSLQSPQKTVVNISLLDLRGRLVTSFNIRVEHGLNLLPLPALATQKDGLYLAVIKTMDGTATQRLVLKK